MKLEMHRPFATDERVYTLTITGSDLARAKLSPMDHAVLHECAKDGASIADTLLGLELIARRIEEAT